MFQLQPYLERIGFAGEVTPSVTVLHALHKAHLLSVPYENLDLLYHRAGSLEIPELYNKIVLRHRGGYCFELNGLFAELLRQTGFEVTEYFGRWLLGECEFPARRHRILKVRAEGKTFIADVGVGCVCPLLPLEFVFDKPQEREGRLYRIVRHERLGCVVQTDTGKGFVNFYSFTEDPQWTVDFTYVHFFCANSPDSVFNREAKIHVFTENGRNSIMDEKDAETGVLRRVLKTANGENRILTEESEFRDALKRYFALEI